jgi:hypothetical protein
MIEWPVFDCGLLIAECGLADCSENLSSSLSLALIRAIRVHPRLILLQPAPAPGSYCSSGLGLRVRILEPGPTEGSRTV